MIMEVGQAWRIIRLKVFEELCMFEFPVSLRSGTRGLRLSLPRVQVSHYMVSLVYSTSEEACHASALFHLLYFFGGVGGDFLLFQSPMLFAFLGLSWDPVVRCLKSRSAPCIESMMSQGWESFWGGQRCNDNFW